MAVERDQLREAVLVRHSLSGLRLQFAPAPSESAYARRFGKMVGVEADPETEFFDVLYRESGGVFRTAFALWQRHIDRVEAGVLYMRYPTTPHYEEIVASLSELDLFTLAAILQHGSLTPGEHSTIFQVNQATSNAWLDNLLARELIEADPDHTGFRVVPEAGEVVRLVHPALGDHIQGNIPLSCRTNSLRNSLDCLSSSRIIPAEFYDVVARR